MSSGTFGGLAGKERRIRFRSHAARRFADDLIADYLEPFDPARRRAAVAPIRGRSEFMPSVLLETNMADAMADSQLELSWDEKSGLGAARRGS